MRKANAIVLVVLAAAAPEAAWAYCRTAACPGDKVGARCEPAESTDCGTALFWPTPCVGFSVQKDGGPAISAADMKPIVETAFSAWMDADCGGGSTPKISVSDLGTVSCDKIEYNQKGANNNAIIFRSDKWPYAATNAIALTTVTYNLDTGEIRDADMELNAVDETFTTSDKNVNVDLLSIVTHEAGHFLGMAHSPVPGATMEADYPPHSITLRSLEADDIAGICAAYPPGNIGTCDPTPRGGLGDACDSPATSSTTGPGSSTCCTIAPGAPIDDASATAALAMLFTASLARRRRVGRGGRPQTRGASDLPRCPGSPS
jgi:hypothetical protein